MATQLSIFHVAFLFSAMLTLFPAAFFRFLVVAAVGGIFCAVVAIVRLPGVLINLGRLALRFL